MSEPLSLIVATYNRAHLLDECLTALRRQPFSTDDEIVVADNASTDGTAAVIAAHQVGAGPRVRYLHVAQPGKSFALQAAVATARGRLLAFLDDDVLVDEGWLAAIRKVMADQAVVLAGGPVLPRWEHPAPRWLAVGDGPFGRLAAPIALLHYGDEPADLGSRTLLGANMVIRRETLDAIGGFATHLGKLRGTLLSGEDADLCARVAAHGWPTRYQPEAVVRHWVPASRMRLRYYASWFYWSGITHAVMDADAPAGQRRFLGLPTWLVRRGAGVPARLAHTVRGGTLADLVDALADLAFVAGYAAVRWRVVTMNPPALTAVQEQVSCPSRPSLS